MKVFTTVLVPAAMMDLVDLATVKNELSITQGNEDTFLNTAIASSSKAIARFCQRSFGVEKLLDSFVSSSQLSEGANCQPDVIAVPIRLARYPVIAISSLLSGGITLAEGDDYRVDAE